MTLAITKGLAQLAGGGDQPLEKRIPLTKTSQDGSPPLIGTQPEAKKKADELKDNIATLVPSPTSSFVPSTSPALLLWRSPHVQVVDLGDGGSSDSESIESNEETKKIAKIEKGQ